MQIDNICVKKTYTRNGEEKVAWSIVGVLKTTDDGKQYIDLNMFPNTSFYVFPPKPKENQGAAF